jgi:serine/threonine protein kinase
MGSERCLALVKLVKDNEMLSEIEVASVVVPLLERLRVLHASGRAHGNVSISTVTIRVVEPADGTIHLPDPEHCAAHRPCVACQREGQTAASDIWSVGHLALQLLLGRPCREEGHAPLVDPLSGELPMLPRGCTLDCIDFLMDCLAPHPEDRASAAELLKHDFLGTIAAPRGPAAADALADSLADSLSDCLLISAERRQQEPACRPGFVPSLKGKGRVCFTAPSHTARCQHCRCQLKCGLHHQEAARPDEQARQEINGMQLVADRAHHIPAKTSPSSNTSKSAASTKRKACSPGPCLLDQPDATPKRKCSGLVKYLSPAILPMRGDLSNAPALVLE